MNAVLIVAETRKYEIQFPITRLILLTSDKVWYFGVFVSYNELIVAVTHVSQTGVSTIILNI